MSEDNISEETNELDDLKSEAAKLGVTHNASIGVKKLKEKIEAHYVSQETSGDQVTALVEKNLEGKAKDKNVEKSAGAVTGKRVDPKILKRIEREKAARKTRIIVIIDNDQRQNNQTTTCSVNCSNVYFDLGTRFLPLGEKIEVCQGHISVLKDVIIPIHARDPKTGLSVSKTRPRYSISYEDLD